MFRQLPRVPRPPLDLVFSLAGLLLALAVGHTILQMPTAHDSWADLLFLGAVTMFLVGIVRFLVRALDIEDDLEDLPVAATSRYATHESDSTRK
jgi:hypothetical protein